MLYKNWKLAILCRDFAPYFLPERYQPQHRLPSTILTVPPPRRNKNWKPISKTRQGCAQPCQDRLLFATTLPVKASLQRWYATVKIGKCCYYCSEDAPCCLDAHHKDPTKKIASITTLLQHAVTKAELLSELRKCIYICKNCHTKLHCAPHLLSKQ